MEIQKVGYMTECHLSIERQSWGLNNIYPTPKVTFVTATVMGCSYVILKPFEGLPWWSMG